MHEQFILLNQMAKDRGFSVEEFKYNYEIWYKETFLGCFDHDSVIAFFNGWDFAQKQKKGMREMLLT